MTQCKFNLAWRGQCGNEAEPFSDYCKEHKDKVCCSCSAPATRECDETMGLVCGYDLCYNCEHTLWSNGCNSAGWDSNTFLPEGLKGHCRKDEQVYVSWIYRTVKEEEGFDPRTCQHTDGVEIAEYIVFCKKCGKILERLPKEGIVKAPFTDEQVKALIQFQAFGMMHEFTCMSYKNCDRSDDNNWGCLIATNDGWVCPCGKYKQDWAWEFMTRPEVLVERYNKIFSQFNAK